MRSNQPRLSLARSIRAHPWLTSAALVTGATAAVGVGLPLQHGEFAPFVIALLTAFLVALILRVVPQAEKPRLAGIVGVAVGLRLAIAALLFYGSLAAGRGGFITGDDANYAGLAWGYVQWLQGDPSAPYVPPLWHGDAYLFGTFVYLESALFWLFGPTGLAMTAVNALFSAVIVVLLYDTTRRIWDAQAATFAAAATAFYPSLVLWSALNLKDTLTLLIIVLVFWLLTRMQARPRWYLLLGFALLLLPLESLRRYIFVALAGVFPIGVLLSRTLLWRRLAWGVASVLTSAALLTLVASTGGLGGGDAAALAGGFAGLERTRQGMALGARTAFVDSRILPVHEGDTYVVVDPSVTTPPQSGARPTASSRVVVVMPVTRLVLESASQASAAPGDGHVTVVRPGDIVVVSANNSATPAPQSGRQSLTLRADVAGADSIQFVASGEDAELLALTRTLAYIPRGLAYALMAPFPWDLGRIQDAATIPEMLLWYLALVSIPFAVARGRRWPELAPILVYIAGLLGILVLVEGNVGTLYRHRAMVIPLVLAVSSPVIVTLATRVHDSLGARTRKARVTKAD